MIQYAFQTGSFNEGMREGLISLIPKLGRDLLKMASWRPIILLNSDYKIISKVITNRIKLHLDKIVNKDQTAFIKGRQIMENIRKIMDILETSEHLNLLGVFLSVDFLKAFDRVEYPAVYKTLEWFNFGPELIKWVKLLFTNFLLYTMNNGYFSNPIKASKGLFQGNPVAPYLFILVMETLAIKIRQNKKIKGLKVGDQELLLILFTDDMGLVLDFKQEVWDNVVYEMDRFQENTGMKINYDKTTVYRLGSLKNSDAKFYSQHKLMWSKNPFKVLGVEIGYDCDICELNYSPLISKTEALLKLWKSRDLSLFGKILIVNTLVGSLFNYKFAALPSLTETQFEVMEKLIENFIWVESQKYQTKSFMD